MRTDTNHKFNPKIILPVMLLSLFCICGITDNQTNAPDNPLSVIIYNGVNFTSSNAKLSKSLRKLKYINKNNEVSSVIVKEGTTARFYSGANYEGCYFEVVGPCKVERFDKLNCGCCSTNSNGWDNEISSIKLYTNTSNQPPGIYGKFDQPAKTYPFNSGSNHSMIYN